MSTSEGPTRVWLLFSISCLGLLLMSGKINFSLSKVSKGDDDLMERREEKLKGFREQKDRFFREDPKSSLKESDRRRFKGLLYYPIDLRYAMMGSMEKYPVEPKPLYVTLPRKEVAPVFVKIFNR